MRWIKVICILFPLLVFLTGCIPQEDIYIEIAVNDLNLPPVFKLSPDKDFEKPILVMWFNIVSKSEKSPYLYWALDPKNKAWRFPVQEITYGVVPDGSIEDSKALPLEPYAKYSLDIYGGHGVRAIVDFTYEPGVYSGYGTTRPGFTKEHK